jgi:hypothetical protein
VVAGLVVVAGGVVVVTGGVVVVLGVVVLELPQLARIETSANRIANVTNNFFNFPPPFIWYFFILKKIFIGL